VLSKVEELKNHTDKSAEYAKEVKRIAEELNALEEKKLGYIFLAEISYAHRKYCDHSRYYVEWDVFDVMRVARVTYNAAEEMLTNYILSKKDIEIELQKNLIAKQNMQRNLFMGGIVLCGLLLTIFWYMLRLRRRRNHALAELNTTKDKFFSIISHDLKTPAVAQRDAIKMLLGKVEKWDLPTLQSFIAELLHSANVQVELLYKLLNWAQLQSGRMTCHPESFDLAPRIISEIALIQKNAEDKGVQLQTEISNPCMITADAEMIATVLRNLLSNAVKFTPKGGTVQLDVERSRNAAYTISISDTGIGMSQQQISELFSLDTLHSHKGTGGEEGSGLGLIICKEFLEKHNSTLHIESEEGNGSRVWFEI
jgi:signal transduction histidine kinase